MTPHGMVALAVGTFLGFVAGTSLAQEDRLLVSDSNFNLTSYEQRLADLEAEVEFLRNERAQNRLYSRDGGGTDSICCPASHFDVGAEVVLLAPHSTTGLGPVANFYFPTNDLFASWRTWLGYTGPNGLGLRARYWDFDHLVANNVNAAIYSLDTFVADFELTYTNVIGDDWEVLVSGGLRHVGFHEERTFVTTSFVDSDLTGVVIGGEVARNLIGGLRGYGIARAATVFGDLYGEVPAAFLLTIENKPTYMWEAQLGLEYFRDTRIGEVSLRVGAEAQYWNEVTYKSDAITRDPESLGFVGIIAGLTLQH